MEKKYWYVNYVIQKKPGLDNQVEDNGIIVNEHPLLYFDTLNRQARSTRYVLRFFTDIPADVYARLETIKEMK